MTVLTAPARRLKRRRRVRSKVRGSAERPRISVFRSNRGICAQLIDDVGGRTLAAVNWYEPELREQPTVGAEHRDARALGRAVHLRADAPAALEALGRRRQKSHARLPTFRATYSPW
jgi:ribosomal protein L18